MIDKNHIILLLIFLCLSSLTFAQNYAFKKVDLTNITEAKGLIKEILAWKNDMFIVSMYNFSTKTTTLIALDSNGTLLQEKKYESLFLYIDKFPHVKASVQTLEGVNEYEDILDEELTPFFDFKMKKVLYDSNEGLIYCNDGSTKTVRSVENKNKIIFTIDNSYYPWAFSEGILQFQAQSGSSRISGTIDRNGKVKSKPWTNVGVKEEQRGNYTYFSGYPDNTSSLKHNTTGEVITFPAKTLVNQVLNDDLFALTVDNNRCIRYEGVDLPLLENWYAVLEQDRYIYAILNNNGKSIFDIKGNNLLDENYSFINYIDNMNCYKMSNGDTSYQYYYNKKIYSNINELSKARAIDKGQEYYFYEAKVDKNNRTFSYYGIKHINGNVITAAIYANKHPVFSEKYYALVSEDDKEYVIDQHNRKIIGPINAFDAIFLEDYIIISSSNGKNIYDYYGKMISKSSEDIYMESDGMLLLKNVSFTNLVEQQDIKVKTPSDFSGIVSYEEEKLNRGYYFFNTENKQFLGPYYWASNFIDGFAKVSNSDHYNTYFINKTGEKVDNSAEELYDDQAFNIRQYFINSKKRFPNHFGGHFYRISHSQLAGIINAKGDTITKLLYDEVKMQGSDKDVVLARKEGNWFFVNQTGEEAPLGTLIHTDGIIINNLVVVDLPREIIKYDVEKNEVVARAFTRHEKFGRVTNNGDIILGSGGKQTLLRADLSYLTAEENNRYTNSVKGNYLYMKGNDLFLLKSVKD